MTLIVSNFWLFPGWKQQALKEARLLRPSWLWFYVVRRQRTLSSRDQHKSGSVSRWVDVSVHGWMCWVTWLFFYCWQITVFWKHCYRMWLMGRLTWCSRRKARKWTSTIPWGTSATDSCLRNSNSSSMKACNGHMANNDNVVALGVFYDEFFSIFVLIPSTHNKTK